LLSSQGHLRAPVWAQHKAAVSCLRSPQTRASARLTKRWRGCRACAAHCAASAPATLKQQPRPQVSATAVLASGQTVRAASALTRCQLHGVPPAGLWLCLRPRRLLWHRQWLCRTVCVRVGVSAPSQRRLCWQARGMCWHPPRTG
jgi:hypothetical protein